MLSVTSKDDDHADAAGDGCLATKRTMVEGMTLPTAMMVMGDDDNDDDAFRSQD